MKRFYLAGMIVGVVAVLIIAGLAFTDLNQQSDRTWDGKYQVGDFIEYYDNSSVWGNSVVHLTVTSANDTEVKCVTPNDVGLTSTTFFPYPGTSDYSNNNPFGMGRVVKGLEVHNVTITYLGKVDVMTKWGVRSCDHYSMEYTEVICDQLLYNGVVVKFSLVGTSGAPIWTQELIDTNLDEIVNS